MRFISSILLIVLMGMVFFAPKLQAQPADVTYASGATPETSSSIAGSSTVDFPLRAVTNKPTENNNYATLKTTGILHSAGLTLTFASEKAASANSPVTVYFRCDANALASTSSITVTAYRGSTTIATSALANYTLSDGTVLMAVTLSANFNSVKVSLLGGGTNGVRIYYAFYPNNPTNSSNPYPFNVADCGLPNVTTIKSTGLTLLGSTNILNPERAIDLDVSSTTFSTFRVGTLSALATMTQTYHFNGDSNVGDGVRIVLGYGSSALNVELLTGISVQAYRGNSVYGSSVNINNLLTLGLGKLIVNSDKFEIHFVPNKPGATDGFDRVDITLNVAVVLTTGDALHVYDIRRIPQMPISQDISKCENLGAISLSATSSQESILTNLLVFNWYQESFGGTSSATGKTFTPTGLVAPTSKEYFVDVTKSGCTVTSPSARKKANVTVLKASLTPPLNILP